MAVPNYIKKIALQNIRTKENILVRKGKYFIDIERSNRAVIRDLNWRILEVVEHPFLYRGIPL